MSARPRAGLLLPALGFLRTGSGRPRIACRTRSRRTCPLTIAFLCSRVLFGEFRRKPWPSSSRSVRPDASIDRLVELVAADMERVNATILSRTGSDVTMIPEVANHLISSGGKRLRPMLTLATAQLCRLCAATATSSSPPRSSSCTPRRCCTTTWSTRATCGAASSPRACCGATRRACWSAISCSARPSR